MTIVPTEKLDFRGMQCPAPILQTARAAKRITDKRILEITADDPAFPLDIQSWCQSSKSKLLGIDQQSNAFTARVLISRAAPAPVHQPPPSFAELPVYQPSMASATAPARSIPALAAVQSLDCRGMQCPAPILKVARTARGMTAGDLEVLADDPAFPLDIQSWCQSSRAKLVTVDQRADHFRALIRFGSDADDKPANMGDASTLSANRDSIIPSHLTNTAPVIALPADQPMTAATFSAALQAYPFAEQATFSCAHPAFITAFVPWCAAEGHQLLNFDTRTQPPSALIQRKPAPVVVPAPAPAPAPTPAAPAAAPAPDAAPRERSCALLILHNDYEALLAAMIVANGALAQGMKVTIFFTFWGLNLLRGESLAAEIERAKGGWWAKMFGWLRPSPKPTRATPPLSTALTPARPSLIQKMFKWMMPKGPRHQALGQFNFGGIGRDMLNGIMRNQNIMSLPELMASAAENDARFIACTMSMSVMGISADEFMDIPTLQLGGVAAFVEAAERADFSMMF